MKGLDLESKNMSFIFRLSCLITFCKHKQWFLLHFEKKLKKQQKRINVETIIGRFLGQLFANLS
jgi:Mg2+ and Co2+ transporter CorA